MRRIALLLTAIAVRRVARWPTPAGACGGLVGENGTIQLTRTSTLAAYHDGVERYVTSFEFTGAGRGGRLDRAAARRSRRKVERGGDWTLQRLEREVQPPVPETLACGARRPSALDKAEVLLQTEDRRARHHDPARRRRRGRRLGARARVPAHARRAEGARLLLPAQQDLHGRSLRRRRAPGARPERGRRHADHAHHPHRRAVGAAADPRPRARQDAGRRRRRVPPHRRAARAARGRTRPRRSSAATRRRAACSTTCARTRAWSGCPTTCGSATCV